MTAHGAMIAIAVAVLALTLPAMRLTVALRDPVQARIEAVRAERLALFERGATLSGTPDLKSLPQRLASFGVAAGAPVFLRVFKEEFELELWMKRDGRYLKIATYPICRWSGGLGPKIAEGDGQSPEGFYAVGLGALNPASRWGKSFNLGFPNAFDAAHGRTGSWVMVHGGCSSVGCFAMTNPAVEEIWHLVRQALNSGQKSFWVHAFPFRMTDENLARHSGSPWLPFWRDLKAGYDAFDDSQVPPQVDVCDGRYRVQGRDEEVRGGAALGSACGPSASRSDRAGRA